MTVKLPPIPERDLLAEVRVLAGRCGWDLVYHTHDSRRSEPGFPDLVMIRGSRLLVAELKSASGTLTDAQRAWLAAFAGVRTVESMVIRPTADYSELIGVLR